MPLSIGRFEVQKRLVKSTFDRSNPQNSYTYIFGVNKGSNFKEWMLFTGRIGQIVELGAEPELESGFTPTPILQTSRTTLVASDRFLYTKNIHK